MNNYNFRNTTNKDKITPYDEILEELRITTPEEYRNMSQEERRCILDKMISLIRKINVFPIYYYNDNGIKKEILKCLNKDVEIKDNILPFNNNFGQHLCRQYFPNMMSVRNPKDKRTMENKFYSDHNLGRIIDFGLKHEIFKPYNMYRHSLIIGGCGALNFKPMVAKAIYEKYVPKNGVIYDFSSGFGGRMLGALSSRNNYTYVGVEPCTETFENLNKLGNDISKIIDREKCFKILKIGSEEFNLNKKCFDFAFSSPPYFDLEIYSDEPTQSTNKFPELNNWFDGFVKPTISNIYTMLKDNRYYAVNIADFNEGGNKNKPVKLVDKWIEISKEIGFTYIEKLEMKNNPRRGDGSTGESYKTEGVYIFKK